MRVSPWFAVPAVVAACASPSAQDAAPDTSPAGDIGAPSPAPSGPASRGFTAVRGALHVHSVFSHDACDGRTNDGPDAPGCLAEFRAQLCTSGVDFAFLTDHPSNMSSYPFERLLLHDAAAGDTLTRAPDGTPVANTVHCPETEGGLARSVVLTVGFESTHTMPLGLEGHLEPLEAERIAILDATPEAERRAVVDAIHARKGVAAIAHSEEDDLSASTIAGLPLDAMEIYNVHANLKAVMSEDITRLFALQTFMSGAEDPPSSDLVMLPMLEGFPEAGIRKWYDVSSRRPITGIIGSDVHQNVTTDDICTPGAPYEAVCDTLEADWPVLVANLRRGGPLLLADGARIDGYDRVFRWFHNRVYTTDTSAAGIREALRAGRQISVFSVFGELAGLDLRAETACSPACTVTELGGTVSLSDAPVLAVTAADAPAPSPWADWLPEEAGAAEIETHVIGFDARGEQVLDRVVEREGEDGTLRFTPEVAGRYHVEVRIRPRHLTRVLRAEFALAERTYRWAVTNPIYVTP
jgi:hypothetical protein